MAPNKDDTIRAKILKTLDRGGFYYPKKIEVTTVPKRAPIASHDEGRAEQLVHDLARHSEDPLMYVRKKNTVALEVDSQRWVAARIKQWDPTVLEWSHEQRLANSERHRTDREK